MEQKNKIGVSLIELITASFVVIGALLMFWKNTDVRLTALEMRINTKDKTDEQLFFKLDKLQESVNELKISLQNKIDKK